MIPVYVAGFERLEMPTGDWSIKIASGCCRKKVWWMSVLLPDPATPVTTVRTPVGISTLTFCKLLALALEMDSLPLAVRQLDLIGTDCFIWRPVRVSAFSRSA